MNNPNTASPAIPRRERRATERRRRKGILVRPAVAGEFGPNVIIPDGAWVLVERFPRAGITFRRLIVLDGTGG